MQDQQTVNLWKAGVTILVALVVLIALILGLVAVGKSFQRYQKRADANNNVKVSAIQIRNQAQRVQIAKQKAQIRFEEAKGIREAQDEISTTLTPLYVQFEAFKALERIGQSGKNNSVYFVPLGPTGLPVVPTVNATAVPTNP